MHPEKSLEWVLRYSLEEGSTMEKKTPEEEKKAKEEEEADPELKEIRQHIREFYGGLADWAKWSKSMTMVGTSKENTERGKKAKEEKKADPELKDKKDEKDCYKPL